MLVSPGCSWYAIQVKYQSEKTVAAMLDWKGYETWSPTHFAERRRSDRIKILQLPLFPGYIFCRVLPSACGLLVSTPGVIGVVSFGGQPYPVTDAEINAIKKLNILGNPQPVPYAQVGQKVRITEGPLSGVTGVVTQIKGSRRLVVSVNMIMKSIAVDVDSLNLYLESGDEDIRSLDVQSSDARPAAASSLAPQKMSASTGPLTP